VWTTSLWSCATTVRNTTKIEGLRLEPSPLPPRIVYPPLEFKSLRNALDISLGPLFETYQQSIGAVNAASKVEDLTTSHVYGSLSGAGKVASFPIKVEGRCRFRCVTVSASLRHGNADHRGAGVLFIYRKRSNTSTLQQDGDLFADFILSELIVNRKLNRFFVSDRRRRRRFRDISAHKGDIRAGWRTDRSVLTDPQNYEACSR
jgi:hypothetical protein